MRRILPGLLRAVAVLSGALLTAALGALPGRAASPGTPAVPLMTTPLKHVIIIMQENRSFDNYFGTYPGANGIPANTCVPLDPRVPTLGCITPFHDPLDLNGGGPHGPPAAQFDIDDGITTSHMDGFVYSQTHAPLAACAGKVKTAACADVQSFIYAHDVMGYHTDEEIPNYWAYAQHFVLQDALFEGVRSWSAPSHLDLTSEWVASCTDHTNAATCTTSTTLGKLVEWPWANLFQLLDAHGVSWKYYLGSGSEPDCEDDEMTCDPQIQNHGIGSFWNPVPLFKSVKSQNAAYLAAHNPDVDQFLIDAENDTLPQVSWVVPAGVYSEHPPGNRITTGMEFVTSLVNAVMTSPAWSSTAIFITWDEWGGFYDHVPPPKVDLNDTAYPVQGFGLRVPGLMISPYAKAGQIDHNILSFDSYATFFEDLFMGSARLDPAKLGTPDKRPDIRDNLKTVTLVDGRVRPVGRLIHEFDFSQAPLPPLILSTHIPTGLFPACQEDIQTRMCTIPTVTLSWSAVAGGAVAGPFTYHVTRDGSDLPQCLGIAVTCIDTPGSGVHLYRTFSVDPTGVASPASAAMLATEP